jgi:hypothetical protein
MPSNLELEFASLWVEYFPEIDLHSEYPFAKPRRFRFDFAHLPSKIAIELQGGIFMPNARHNNGAALVKEYEKLCLASSLGWRIFFLSSVTVSDENVYKQIATAIRQAEAIKKMGEIPKTT